ncbi:heterokaryon incompatibility protein-domain-containing protein [Paraphoma chrysanthemicola]|uniref:Heterokaryon incompatibility protein-domain-containing protein n=1 Tax=Paraphoma chrysanthemicola TaxID=798071 RepID=A0A8K0RED7_9PLEO|nr:heterokaryon incompatibility protein-domain-containing protein [Paraphoma chrysanthemicola]
MKTSYFEMTSKDHNSDNEPTLQQIHEENFRGQYNIQQEQRVGWETYLASWKDGKQLNLIQRAERCKNIQRAKTMTSVKLLDLMTGCATFSHMSCALCGILYRAVRSSTTGDEFTANGTISWPSLNWYEPTWSIGGRSGKEFQRQIEIFSIDGYFKFLDCPSRTLVPSESMCEQSIHQILSWFAGCQCYPDRSPPLPSRVLDVTDPALIRLREHTGSYGKYACLSHCWGQIEANGSLVTTRATYKAHMDDGIRFESLPKLFQDAVQLAHALKIPYLWIDALCIMQGDEDDWRQQSANMRDIYRNSYVTFAATSASDSQGSCASYLPPLFDAQGVGDYAYARQKLPHFRSDHNSGTDPPLPTYQSTQFPLLERAWVYQERLLAPRVLHLTAHELVFECAESTICQCSNTDQTYVISEGDPKVDHAMALAFGGTDVSKRWRTVVQEYSPLRLTFAKDRLPALAGLAHQFAEHRPGDTYLAGVWRRTLFADMLWTAFPGPAAPLQIWRAPSWSWACIQGAIRYRAKRDKYIISFPELVEAYCESSGVDSMGEVKPGAYLVLKGQVIISVPEGTGMAQSRLSSASSQLRFCDYYPDRKDGVSNHVRTACGGIRTSPTTYSLRLARDECAVPATEYFLVLEAVDACANVYRRIGLAECRDGEVLALFENMYRDMQVKII